MNRKNFLSLLGLGFLASCFEEEIDKDMNVKKIFWHFLSGGRSWYVRPSGGSYGTEDGTSYDNAWDGFSNIVWGSIMPGDRLRIAGTHTQLLTVGASGVAGGNIIIDSYGAGDPGIIDSQNIRSIGLDIINKQYITIQNLKSINATNSCFRVTGTTSYVYTYNLEASDSGDQGIQNNVDVSNIYHYNAYCHDNVDDGISSHSTIANAVNVIGGVMENNADGIGGFNIIATGVTFIGNTNDVDASGVSIFTDCDFTANVFINSLSTGSIFNNCTFVSVDSNGSATINSAVIPSLDLQTSTSNLTLNNCLVVLFTGINEKGLTANRCYIRDHIEAAGIITLKNCYTDITTDQHITTVSGSTLTLEYHTFSRLGNAKYAVWIKSGTTSTLSNLTVYDSDNNGRGILADISITITNCILTGLGTALVANGVGVVITENNCCLFSNTANTGGTGTVTPTGRVTTNPLLSNPASNDFSLSLGSSCDGTGATLTNDQGNDSTTDWGDGSTVIPVVTLAEQAVAWNIGAYV